MHPWSLIPARDILSSESSPVVWVFRTANKAAAGEGAATKPMNNTKTTAKIVNKHCPGQGEVKHYTLTLVWPDHQITKVEVTETDWKNLSVGDSYAIP
jgi:hypothetical protein